MTAKQSKKPSKLPKTGTTTRGGYVGKILRVDLTKGAITTEGLPKEKILRQYVGATGLAVKLLHDELPVHVKPLDPENRVIFMTAPMTGTFYPCIRWVIPIHTVFWGLILSLPATTE
jgi:aldehyde:ferredoxin oxidoreductase